jgi:hypothetical protein
MKMDKMTEYLMSVAACVDNYSKYLNKDLNDYSSVLGYVFRMHQDKIKKVSPQGLALILMYLKDVKEEDYGKYIDVYKEKVDKVISSSKTVEEHFKKMDKIKKSIK